MSWNFRKVGTLRDALKASVQAESAPQAIRDEVCARIDGRFADDKNECETGKAVYVASHGHLETNPDRPWYGVSDIKITVETLPLINTPL